MRRRSEEIVYALFDSPHAVEKALKDLYTIGVTLDDVSILMTEDTRDGDFAALALTRSAEGVATGGVVGGFVGIVLGGLAALGSAMTGGIGLMVMGPAMGFAAAGGLIGGLIGHGIPEAEAKHLHDEVAAGKVLVAVHVNERHDTGLVRRVLDDDHGEEVEMPRPHAAESLSI